MQKIIKLVSVGKYVGAVKYGKCPMYAITSKDKVEDLKAGLKEDFPEYKIVDGNAPDKQAIAQFILRSRERYADMGR